MSSASNGEPREYQDGSRYFLPKDAPEHERLDAQSASLINLMNDQPFRAPLSNPKRILDIGCGTGTMTHLLGTLFPEAEVIGVDLAPVPETRHGRLSNVTYIQGDIATLAGQSEQFAWESFDYIYERLLMLGMADWPSHVALTAKLLKSGGWLEFHETDACLRSATDAPIGYDMPWFRAMRADSAAKDMDVEIGRHLQGHFQAVPELDHVRSERFPFPPKMVPGREMQAGLIEQLPALFHVILDKLCATRRSEQEVAELTRDMNTRWEADFEQGDHFNMFAAYGQKR